MTQWHRPAFGAAGVQRGIREWLVTLDEQGRTTFFAAVESATSLTVARKIARHPDRPDAVDALGQSGRLPPRRSQPSLCAIKSAVGRDTDTRTVFEASSVP